MTVTATAAMLKDFAELFVDGCRNDCVPEHEIENEAHDKRLREFVGEDWLQLTDAECQVIRDHIMKIVG